MVTTRFAPTVNSELHAGSIANALLNWLAARAAGGRFLLRFDGGNDGPVCREIRDGMRRDLTAFGFDWDGEWSFAEHQAEVYERCRQWVMECDAAYACHCGPEAVAARWEPRGGWGEGLERVDRPDKYPPVDFAVEKIGLVGVPHGRMFPNRAEAEHEARGPLLVGPPMSPTHQWRAANVCHADETCWRPFDVGYTGPHSDARLEAFWTPAVPAHEARVVFPHGLPQEFAVYVVGPRGMVEHRHGTNIGALPHDTCFRREPAEAVVPLPGGFVVERIVVVLRAGKPLFIRQYHYDRDCAHPLSNFSPIAKRRGLEGQADAVRLDVPGCHPTAVWFEHGADIAWTSAVMDQELGVTDVIRGRDLEKFAVLEETVARVLGYAPRRRFHGLLTDARRVKLAKSHGARRAVELGAPSATLGRLAKAMGLMPDAWPCTPRDILAGGQWMQADVSEDVVWEE